MTARGQDSFWEIFFLDFFLDDKVFFFVRRKILCFFSQQICWGFPTFFSIFFAYHQIFYLPAASRIITEKLFSSRKNDGGWRSSEYGKSQVVSKLAKNFARLICTYAGTPAASKRPFFFSENGKLVEVGSCGSEGKKVF